MNVTGSINTSNIFRLIKDQYGASVLADIRRLKRLRIKYGKFSNHLRFSLRCLQDRENDRESTSESIVDKDKWIVNLSDKQLSDNEQSLLIKGMKFAITPKHIPKEEIIAKVESSLKGIEKPEADTI